MNLGSGFLWELPDPRTHFWEVDTPKKRGASERKTALAQIAQGCCQRRELRKQPAALWAVGLCVVTGESSEKNTGLRGVDQLQHEQASHEH